MPVRTLAELQAHREVAHSTTSIGCLPFFCRKCSAFFAHRAQRNRHETCCSAPVIDTSVVTSIDDAPLPETCEDVADEDSATVTESSLAMESSPFEKGGSAWVLASIANLETEHNIPMAALEKFIMIVRDQSMHLGATTLPESVRDVRTLRAYVDRNYSLGAVRVHGNTGAHKKSVAISPLERIRKRARCTAERLRPSLWYSLDTYAIVKRLYKDEWAAEIQQAAAEHASAETYSSVRSGTIYQQSPFFIANPDAAALALYSDSASIGDTKSMHML